VAVALTAVVATGYVATGIAMFAQVGGARTHARQVFATAGIDPDTLGGLQVFASTLAYVFAVITIVAGLILLAAAAAVRSGSRPGRVFAWVVMALALLCGFSALSQSGTAEFAGVAQVTTYSFDGDRIRQSDGSLPSTFSPGYRITAGTFSVLALVALAVAIILLAQRSASRYFPLAGPVGESGAGRGWAHDGGGASRLPGGPMTIVSRTFAVSAAPDRIIDYLRDFGNTEQWDPATQRTTRIDAGPITVGSSWHNASKFLGVTAELTYTLTAVARDRLVFIGRNEGATSVDTITVRPVAGGSEITYHVDLEMHGLAKLMTPVMKIEFEKLGNETAARLTDVLNQLTSAA
jgi:carbon monoxide dehydrogenase subunit G